MPLSPRLTNLPRVHSPGIPGDELGGQLQSSAFSPAALQKPLLNSLSAHEPIEKTKVTEVIHWSNVVELSRTGLGRATIRKNNLVVCRALLSEELRKGQLAVRGYRLLIRIYMSIRIVHDTKECHKDIPLYLLLHLTSFTYSLDPSLRSSSQ